MKVKFADIVSGVLVNINKYCISPSFISSNEDSMVFQYPYLSDTIINNLLGEGGTDHTSKYFMKYDKDFLLKYRKYRNMLSNKLFDLYENEYELSEYFVKNNDLFSELNKIFEIVDDPELIYNIAIKGNKGSGKTAFINCWLHETITKLEEKKIFPIRCDGYKLYKLWEENGCIISISDYLSVRLIYVFCKFSLSSKRNFGNNIINSLKQMNIEYDFPSSRKDHNAKEKRFVCDEILNLRKKIQDTELNQKEIPEYAFEDVVKFSAKSHHEWEKRKWLALSGALKTFMYNNGYWLLNIIDGVDNLHVNDSGSDEYYNQILGQLFDYLVRSPPPKNINLVILREKTYYDCRTRPPMPDTVGYEDVYIIKNKTACFRDILSKRNDYSEDHAEEASLFLDICKEISSVIPNDNNIYHHENARTFLYNKLSLISQIYYRLKQIGITSSGQTNISNQVNIFEQRNKYLNGRFFLQTQKDWPQMNSELGLCCMNIFYYDIDKYPCSAIEDWQGLCKTRILQLLVKYKHLTDENIVYFLHEALGYNASLVGQNIRDLKAIGMIDTNFDFYKYLTISKKGSSYLHNSFSDIDTLYYFCLDTAIPLFLVDNKLLHSHDNKFNVKSNYQYSSLSTALTFIVFLNHINIIENKKLDENRHLISPHFRKIARELSLPFEEDVVNRTLRAFSQEVIDTFNDKEVLLFAAFIKNYQNYIHSTV